MLPFLAILYAVECFVYVKRGHLLFNSFWGRRFRVSGEGPHFVALTPFGRAFFSERVSPLLGVHGLFLPEENEVGPRSKAPTYIAYSEISEVQVSGRRLLLDNKFISKSPTEKSARAMSDNIRRFIRLDGPSRARALDQMLTARFSLSACLTSLGRIESAFAPLSALCLTLYLTSFIVAPVVVYTGLSRVINPLALGCCLLALFIATIVVSYLTARGFYGTSKAITTTVLEMISPANAMRARTDLEKDLLDQYDHLTLAAALVPKKDFALMARSELIEIEKVLRMQRDGEVADSLTARRRAVVQLVESLGLSLKRLFAPPSPRETNATKYCPRCMAQHVASAALCSECGIELREF